METEVKKEEAVKRPKKKIRVWAVLSAVLVILLGIIGVLVIKAQSLRRLSDNKITMKTGGQTFLVTLYDNPTANDLFEKLPMTLTVSDYAGYDEKVIRLEDTLSMENAPAGDNPGIPEVGYYEPGNWIALYYGFIGYWPGKVPLGKIEASCKELEEIPDNAEITIEKYVESGDGGQEEAAQQGADNGKSSSVPKFDFESKTVILNDGNEMPVIGLGTWTLDDETAENSVYHALKDGYRLIDTAKYYGNEKGVGDGVRKAVSEGICRREDIFITSKVVPYGFDDYEEAIRECNETLGLDYIDLMLIHQQGSDEKELYAAIEKAVKDGIVHSLGISNYYTKEDFDRITEGASIMPCIVQNENHPFYQNTEFQEYVAQYGVIVESYYPFGGRGHTQDVFNHETIAGIAEAHGKTPAQILVRWHLQAGYIAIPGSGNPEHIAENYDIFDFELSGGEMKKIREMDTGKRYENW